jgi:DNA-binding NarL/FixJ family response regulator
MYEMRRNLPEPNAVKAARATTAVPRLPRLTGRERDVLAAVVSGDTNHEIGLRLGIGAQTVKRYVSVLIHKFYVRNRIQLAVLVALDMPELLNRGGSTEERD